MKRIRRPPSAESYQLPGLFLAGAKVSEVALLVEPQSGSTFGPIDSDDGIYLSTALAGRADVLITGRIRHFRASRYGPIAIFSPADFLARHG